MSPAAQARAQPAACPSGRGRWASGERVRCPLVCVGFVPVPGSRFPLPPSLGWVRGSGGPPPVGAGATEGGGFGAVAVFYDAEVDELGGGRAAIDRFLQLVSRRHSLPPNGRPGGLPSSSDPGRRTGCLCELSGPVGVGEGEGHGEFRLRAVAAVRLSRVCGAGGGMAAPRGEVTVEVSVLGEPGGQRLPSGALTDALHHSRRIWRRYDPERLAAALFEDVASSLARSGVTVPPRLLRHPSDLSYWVLRNISFQFQGKQDDVQWALDAPHVPERLRRCLKLVRRDYRCHKSQDNLIGCGVCKVLFTTVKELIQVSEEETEVSGRFINPHGATHEIVQVACVLDEFVEVVGEGPVEEDSWFPGYAWECACCRICRQHVGWRFSRVDAAAARPTFFGLRRAAIVALPPRPGLTSTNHPPGESDSESESEWEEGRRSEVDERNLELHNSYRDERILQSWQDPVTYESLLDDLHHAIRIRSEAEEAEEASAEAHDAPHDAELAAPRASPGRSL